MATHSSLVGTLLDVPRTLCICGYWVGAPLLLVSRTLVGCHITNASGLGEYAALMQPSPVLSDCRPRTLLSHAFLTIYTCVSTHSHPEPRLKKKKKEKNMCKRWEMIAAMDQHNNDGN